MNNNKINKLVMIISFCVTTIVIVNYVFRVIPMKLSLVLNWSMIEFIKYFAIYIGLSVLFGISIVSIKLLYDVLVKNNRK